MTRLEPLTSLALGRSPYDEVVQGEGEEDHRAPAQQYDERGRPVNPEAKRLNRDLIRAHNEVMLAIGVAETDDGAAERLELQQRELSKKEADAIGQKLCQIGGAVQMAGVWGVHGLRNRIMVYRQYSQIPFADLFRYELSRRSLASLNFSTLPSYGACIGLKMFLRTPFSESPWVRAGVRYAFLHLEAFVFLQRLELVSPNAWFPGPQFFVPFSASSPIPRPPPLQSFSLGGVLQWLGGVAVSVAPMVALWGFLRLSTEVRRWILPRIFGRLPRPVNYRTQASMQPPTSSLTAEPTEQQPAASRDAGDGGPRAANDGGPRDEQRQAGLVGDEQPGSDGSAPAQPVRRQSTMSSTRGDDYGSDDDDAERVSVPLISFDVEAAESTDTHFGGQWSAELRPNVPDALGSPVGPVYTENALTRLPALLAADILTLVASNVLLEPFEAFTLRTLARSYCQRLGIHVAGLYGLNPFSGLSWLGVGNLLTVEMAHLMAQGDIWVAMVLWADSYTKTPLGT